MKAITFLFFLMLMTTEIIFSQTPPGEAKAPPELAKWRAANYSNVRYKLNITLEKGAPLVKGAIEIRVNISKEGIKNHLFLDWRTAPFIGDKDKPYASVIGVNDATDFISQVTAEHILIPSGYLKTGENVIKIEFASPVKTAGAAVTRYVDKEDGAEYIYALFAAAGASTAFPVFDQPDLKAKFSLSVVTQGEWNVVSNTNSKETFLVKEDGLAFGKYKNFTLTGDKEAQFEETKPLSPDAFAFAAGEFAVFADSDAPTTFRTEKIEPDETVLTAKNTEPKSEVTMTIDRVPPRMYVRKSQAAKFKQYTAEVFRLNRAKTKDTKNDIVVLPGISNAPTNYDGLVFMPESSVFR
jgi:Peptidase M1 N-terminal domain